MKLKHQIAMQMIEVQRAERFLNTEHEHLQELKAQRLQCQHVMVPATNNSDMLGPTCSECGITDLELCVEKQIVAQSLRSLPGRHVSKAFRQVLNDDFRQFNVVADIKA